MLLNAHQFLLFNELLIHLPSFVYFGPCVKILFNPFIFYRFHQEDEEKEHENQLAQIVQQIIYFICI